MKFFWLLVLFAFTAVPLRAVEVADDGIGSVLLFPYYVARANNSTLISINNQSERLNIAKVNLFEADNGVPVLSFNLYLGGNSTWTANISADENGQTWLSTNNRICTVPDFFANNPEGPARVQIGANLLDDLLERGDPGRNSQDRAAEGHIEVITMGSTTGPEFQPAFDVFARDCNTVVDAWNPDLTPTPGIWTNNSQFRMQSPNDDLRGEATIINVGESRAFNYTATALKRFYVPDDSMPPSLNSPPSEAMPRLDQAFPAVSRVFNTLNSLADSGFRTIVTDTWSTGLEAVEAALTDTMGRININAETSIDAHTEVVLSQPTRALRIESIVNGSGTPGEAGFIEMDGRLCDSIGHRLWDRAGELQRPYDLRDPPTPAGMNVCQQIVVLTYRNSSLSTSPAAHEAGNISSDILGSRVFETLVIDEGPVFEMAGQLETSVLELLMGFGSARFDMVNPNSGNIYKGLPVIGFVVRDAQATPAFFATHSDLSLQTIVTPPEDN